MGMWVTDPETGRLVWDENAQIGQGQAGYAPSGASSSPTISAFQPEPPASTPAVPGVRDPGGPTAPAPGGPGTTVGGDYNWGGPEIDLSGVGRNGPGQAYLEAFNAASGGSGAAFPDAPTFTADPAAAAMADRAAKRDAQMQVLFDEMRGDVKERDPSRRTGLQRFGEFLSALAASGRLEDAGMIWNEMDQRYRQEGADLRNEMRQISLASFDSEDNRAQAQAGLLSAEHQAGERTTAAGYQRDIGAFQAEESRADRTARTAIARAEAGYTIARDEEARRQQALGLLLGVPGVGAQAGRELASGLGFQNDAAGSAVAESLAMPMLAQGLLTRIESVDLSNGRARGELADYLKQWDPTITANDLREADPEMIYRRVVNGTGAREAFRRNQDLATTSRYQSYIARPAE